MNYQYKIIVSTNSLYKEFQIPEDMERVKLGTTSGCDFRLNSDFFFENIELELEKKGQWLIKCQDNLYMNRGDILKLFFAELSHGDILSVCYANSGEAAFEIRFMIDFEAEISQYNWKIDLAGNSQILISDAHGSDIQLVGPFSRSNKIYLFGSGGIMNISEESAPYGVYVNGKRIHKNAVLCECDFISVGDFSGYYRNQSLYFGERNVRINNHSAMKAEQKMHRQYPMFVRNTRVKVRIDEEPIKILDPEPIPAKPELNVITTLMPTVVMFALIVVLRGIMDTSGGAYVLFSICSMGMAIVTSVMNMMNTQKKYKLKCNERTDNYYAYIDRKQAEIQNARNAELDCLRYKYYSTEQDLAHIERFSHSLFDRIPEDEDFLEVYLGTGVREAKKIIDYKKQEKLQTGDELCQMPEKLSENYKYLADAPVTVSLKNANAVGVIGKKENLYQIFKCFIVDIISRQYYGDVKIYALLDPNVSRYEWLQMLPHIQGNGSFRNIVCDSESKNNVFEYLYKELTLRSEMKDLDGYNVVLVMNENGIKSHPISKFIEKASELNTVFVFFEEKEARLPLYCSKIIKILDNKGMLFDSADMTKVQNFNYTDISDSHLQNAAEILAPVYCEEISLENSLRKNISLFELLGIYSADDLDLGKRWSESKIYDTMAVPLGVNVKDEVVYLNLHEKYHGPHGLVAGTTGSGKSEILQAFILSAATYFHPYEIGFVIIDFKGGGMVNQFKDLPHLLGAITNIDGNEVQRSLKSIKAELLKRQSYFAMAGVNHIDKYIQLYKEGKAAEALPHLVIIVDEFAELKAEQPEFMKELISAARIGRSLGVHLILATQKPSGVVDAQIWSNSKFKLCLKVQSKEDSNEVIKTPLAAEIKEPGRAYLQVGNNELFELFQSAYSGAPAAVDASEIDKEFTISQVSFSGTRKPVYVRKKQKKKTGHNKNQLEAVVEYINEYCAKANIPKLSDICLPPLPEVLEYERCERDPSENIVVGLGIVDDPEHQMQSPLFLNLTEANYVVIGSGQTGKTNILQSIVRNLAENYTPEEVNIYILDFGSMILRNFEQLNHVGGVVCSFEDEKLRSLLRLLHAEINTRKTRLAEVGVSSFSAYKEAGMKDLPQIVVLVDNLTVLKELYLQEEDLLLPLCRDGVAVGITFVIANAQTAGISYRYLNNFEGRMALFCNETSEYGMVLEGSRMKLPNIAGRALIQLDKNIYESQMYIAFEGDKEFERVQAIQKFVSERNKEFVGRKATLIPEIPKNLTADYVKRNLPAVNKENHLMLGLDYTSIVPEVLDLTASEMLVLSGKKGTGKDEFAKYFVDVLLSGVFGPTELYILDDMNGKWGAYEFHEKTTLYSTTSDAAISAVNEISQLAESRYLQLASRTLEHLDDEPWLVLLIESNDAILSLSANKSVMAAIRNILGKYKSMKVFLFLTNIENTTISFHAPELLKLVKDNKRYLIYDDIKNIKLCDVSVSLSRKYTKPLEINDAYYMNDAEVKKLRTVKP